MKRYLLVATLITLFLTNLSGAVRNGYEKDAANFRVSIQSLKNILLNDQHLSHAERRKIKERIRVLVNHMVYYEITDTLLRQFRTISPDLYNEIDSLKDSKGRIIDVYVKFIPKEQARVQAAGMASFTQAQDDLNSCNSEYGAGTISVKIWILSKALWALSHEFGHIKYLVPNLISYVEFYRKEYRHGLSEPVLGHEWDDPSGKVALMFEERFREGYFRYLKLDYKPVISPLLLISPIRKNFLQNLAD